MIEIKNIDCFEYLESLPDESVDSVILDMPYGVLGDHKIETNIDKIRLTKEVFRVLKKDAFYVFFGQMPTSVDWCIATAELFKFQDHITWAKRMQTAIYLQLVRTHEDIMIYKKGNPKFNETKQKYEDVKLEQINLGLSQMQSIEMHISALWQRLNGTAKKYTTGTKRNEAIYDNFQDSNREGMYKAERMANLANTWAFELTKQEFDTVWSFAPQNKTSFGKNGENWKHPTVKPVKLLDTLIKLVSKEGDAILDCFLGSGTTAVSCCNTNRNFKGCELDKDYYEMSVARVNSAIELNKYKQTKMF